MVHGTHGTEVVDMAAIGGGPAPVRTAILSLEFFPVIG
jgi:hypothetical protein